MGITAFQRGGTDPQESCNDGSGEYIDNLNVSTVLYSLHLFPSLMHLGVLFI